MISMYFHVNLKINAQANLKIFPCVLLTAAEVVVKFKPPVAETVRLLKAIEPITVFSCGTLRSFTEGYRRICGGYCLSNTRKCFRNIYKIILLAWAGLH